MKGGQELEPLTGRVWGSSGVRSEKLDALRGVERSFLGTDGTSCAKSSKGTLRRSPEPQPQKRVGLCPQGLPDIGRRQSGAQTMGGFMSEKKG